MADEVALDQVAEVGGTGDRYADVEALDGQPAQDGIGGVEREADVGRASGDVAAVDDDAGLCVIAIERRRRVGDRRDQGRTAGDPPIVDVATTTLGLFPPVKLLVAVRLGIASWP